MIPLVIDTDPGIDDAMAIAYAIAHPDLDLLALTTVFGNTSIDFATRNARWLLERFGAPEAIVARGAGVPLVRAPEPFPDFVHGADGLGNVYPTDADALAFARGSGTLDAADCLIDLARRHEGSLAIVAVGPLTNLAEALRREPALPSLVGQLIVMGGTLIEPGNVTPVAEANFFNDPHAADAVLAHDWPTTVVGLDVTHRISLLDTELDTLGREAGATGALLRAASRFYVDFYTGRAATRGSSAPPACAMHDAAAIAALLMPDAFERVHGPARVIDAGLAQGQLVVDYRGDPEAAPGWRERPSIAICTAVDAARAHDDFLARVRAGYRR